MSSPDQIELSRFNNGWEWGRRTGDRFLAMDWSRTRAEALRAASQVAQRLSIPLLVEQTEQGAA